MQQYLEEAQQRKAHVRQLFKHPNLKPFLICLLILVFVQFSGVTEILYNMDFIIQVTILMKGQICSIQELHEHSFIWNLYMAFRKFMHGMMFNYNRAGFKLQVLLCVPFKKYTESRYFKPCSCWILQLMCNLKHYVIVNLLLAWSTLFWRVMLIVWR